MEAPYLPDSWEGGGGLSWKKHALHDQRGNTAFRTPHLDQTNCKYRIFRGNEATHLIRVTSGTRLNSSDVLTLAESLNRKALPFQNAGTGCECWQGHATPHINKELLWRFQLQIVQLRDEYTRR